jgi:ATP-dependent DNA helicase RecG
MALPVNLQQLLHGQVVEWERLEFKQGWNPEDVIHTLCAFANDFRNWGGGYLIVGVEESDGRPVMPPAGLPAGKLDGIQRALIELGHKIRPAYHPLAEPAVVEGQSVLVIWAPAGEQRPYRAPLSLAEKNREFPYYIRRGSATIRAQGADEHELLGLANRIPFDDRINQRAVVRDLQLPLIQNFLHEVKSELAAESEGLPLEVLGRQMHLVSGPPEALRPLNVGLLFFNSHPAQFFPGTQIDVAIFPAGRGGDHFSERTFKGPLGAMLQEALGYLQNAVVTEYVQKRPNRAEAERHFNVPYAAVKEALVNAVYHRSYEEREPIEVQVTPEEVAIASYPGPDRSIKLEDFRFGRAIARRYRNRRIGEFLKELELSEGRGTGIPKILRAMRQNGSAEPQFETNEERTYFLVRLVLRPPPQAEASPVYAVNEAAVPEGIGNLPAPPVGLVRLMLAFCRRPRTAREIRERLRLKDVRSLRARALQPALKAGWLEGTIPEKPRNPKQRYLTTEAGLQHLRHGR